MRVIGVDMGGVAVNARWLFGWLAPPLGPVPPHPSPLPRGGEGIVVWRVSISLFCSSYLSTTAFPLP